LGMATVAAFGDMERRIHPPNIWPIYNQKRLL
jgi:hypothetical protein